MMKDSADPHDFDRRGWMSLLAKARPDALRRLFPDLPDAGLMRAPEIGAVMVQGRIGGVGAPFNLGEMTVTRCSVQTEIGAVGHAYVQGRDKDHALRAAIIDALMQTDRQDEIRDRVLVPLAAEAMEARALRAGKAAATKVDFFTMVRGEDK